MKIWKRDYYEKLLAGKKSTQTVQHYHLQIQEAQKKIEELQSQCSHNTYQVVFWSWRPGAMQPSHVCTECNKCLGQATDEESKELWDTYNGKISQAIADVTPTIKKR